MRGLLFALFFAIGLLPPTAARAAAGRPLYEISANVSDDLERIEGTVSAQVTNDGPEPLDRLVLWLYPNLFADDVPGVTDANRDLFEPWGAGRGSITVSAVMLDGAPVEPEVAPAPAAPERTRYELRLPAPLPPGGTVRFEAAFTTRMPHRLGPFSHAHDVLTALGGWYPYVLPPQTRTLDRRPPPSDFRIVLQLPKGHVALVGGERPIGTEPVVLQGREWADLVVRKKGIQPLRTRGATLWPMSNPPDQEWRKETEPNPPPLPTTWVADEVTRLLGNLAEWADAQPEIPITGPIQAVIVPMRSEIALATPGILAISDRAFEVTPVRFIERFHARGIARAYLARRFLPLVRGCETPGMAPQIADALGALYAERFAREVLGGTGDARGFLDTLDFLPSVDDFLRSPRAAFAHLYFQPVADPIPVRDEPWTFNDTAPRGKLLFEKLSDWIGADAFDEAVADYLKRGVCPFERAAEESSGLPLDPFFRVWTDRLPREDLRVHILSVNELPDGRFLSEVGIERIGDAPPEVIEMDAWEDDGTLHRLEWRADEGVQAHVWEITAPAPIDKLRADPRGRVFQTPAERGEIAALGDRIPSRFQLLLTRLNISYSTSDRAFFGDVDVLLRPREAVRRRLGVGASIRKARVEGRTALTFGFGPLVDAARYAWNWGVGLRGDYLRGGYGEEGTSTGYALGPILGLSYDDRPPSLSPMRGQALALGMSLNLGGSADTGTTGFVGTSAAVLRMVPLGGNQSLAFRLKANAVFGEPPIQELIPLGGSDEGLRGFPLEEVLSKQRYVASAEYRHPILPDVDVNLGIVRVRNVTGAFFVDGARAEDIFPLTPETPRAGWFGDVGYGLRFGYDLLGVRPLLFGVDAAFPINRFQSSVNPVTITFRAGQAFSGL